MSASMCTGALTETQALFATRNFAFLLFPFLFLFYVNFSSSEQFISFYFSSLPPLSQHGVASVNYFVSLHIRYKCCSASYDSYL